MFWEEMTDQNFDLRLRIFFDMCDKNGDGKLSEDEVAGIIVLSASENKLGKLKANTKTYASLIMGELDPDDRGYIEVQIGTHSFTFDHVYGSAGAQSSAMYTDEGSWKSSDVTKHSWMDEIL